MGAMGAAAIVLGYWGFGKHFADRGETRSFLDLTYLVLQLFTIESGAVPAPPWQLEAARFLAPIVPAWALVKALAAIFGEQLLALRLRFLRGHVVICGLGRKGLQLAKDFRAQGLRVVALELDPSNSRIGACKVAGVFVLIGDAADRGTLRKARPCRAKYVIGVAGDDLTNIAIASLTCELARNKASPFVSPVQCIIHVVSLKLCALLTTQDFFREKDTPVDVTVFNIYENTARLMSLEYPLDRGLIRAGDPREVHLVVVGFGLMGQSLTLQTAKEAHFANGKKPRVTVIDRRADPKRRIFYGRYPQFDKACRLSFVSEDAESLDVLERIKAWASDKNALTAVVISLDDDSRATLLALSILHHLADVRVPIFIRTAEELGLANVLNQEIYHPESLENLHSFGVIRRCCTAQVLLHEDLDRLARATHERYRAYVAANAAPGKTSTKEPVPTWDDLDPQLQDSNRQQADHIPVKLRAVGCISAPREHAGTPVEEFEEQEVEILAHMEHSRWNAERFLAGWTLGPKSVSKKTSPYLVPWEELPENIKEYDRCTVREIPQLLELIGEKVVRIQTLSPADSAATNEDAGR